MAPRKSSKSRRQPPRTGEFKESSGKDESKTSVPGSSSSNAAPGTGESKESSGRDESKAPAGSSSSHANPRTGESKESSGEDQSTAPAGSTSPQTPPRSGDAKDSSDGDDSKAPAPGSSSSRPPLRTTDPKESSGADKSNSPPGKGRLINPTLPGRAGPKESQGTDRSKSKSKSERARTSKEAPVAESSFNVPQSTDQQSNASPAADRSIIPPATEGSKEDSLAESTSNTPQTSEQSDVSAGADRPTVPPPRDSPEAASVAEFTSKPQKTTEKYFAESMAGSASKSRQLTEKYHMSPVASILTGLAGTKPGSSKYRDRTTLLADTSVYLPPAYFMVQSPPPEIFRTKFMEQIRGKSQSSSGLDEATAPLAKDAAKVCTVGSETPDAPPDTDVSQMSSVTYKLKELSTPEGSKTYPDIERSKAPPRTGKSPASTVSDEPKATPIIDKSKASPPIEKLPASPVIDNPKAPSSTTDKPKEPNATDYYARKWGSKLGTGPVINKSKSTPASSTGMKSKPLASSSSSEQITKFGLVVGPDPNYAPTGKGRLIRPVVRPSAGPKESQVTDKSKSEGTDNSKSKSKSQATDKSKSQYAVLDGLMGKEDNLAGVPVYISGSTNVPSAIILMSDIYGFTPRLFRKVADKVAAAGYLAVIPDYFNGDPYKMVEGENPMSAFPEWLAKHPAATVENVELTKKLIEFMKDNYRTTYVGLAGFGYGAKIAITVGKGHDAKSIVQLNPLFVEASDYEEVAVPIAVVAAPEDGVDKHTEILKSRSKKLEIVVKIYPGAVPGWPVRYDEKDQTAVRKANTAHKVMLDWFFMHM